MTDLWRIQLVRLLAEERVAAAGVGPHTRERDLAVRALLEQETPIIVEEEDREGAVQEAAGLVGEEEVGVLLAGMADDGIGFINENALVCVHELLLADFA